MAALCRPPLERLGLEIEIAAHHWRELSACYVVVMPKISFSLRYTLTTPLVESVGRVSKSVVDCGSNVPSPSPSSSEVNCYALLCLECGLAVV
jgi:hypothetical protein